MKPYYQDESVTLFHGDCVEVMASLAPGSVDMVFTSPPYNLGKMSGGLANLAGGYRSYQDTREADDYTSWQHDVLRSCWDLLADDGAIFYNHKPLIAERQVTLPTIYNPGLPLRQVVIWYRQMGVNWAPTHYLPVHEWLMILAKPDWELRDKSASHLSDVWAIRPDMGKNEHPAPFPVALPARAIESTRARIVLDPFMGSGTTALAARNAGRKVIGIELDERYCEIAARRLDQGVLDFGVASC